MTENLTRTRYDIYKQAVAKYGKRCVWTSEGKVIVKIGIDKHYVISLDDLISLPPSVNAPEVEVSD